MALNAAACAGKYNINDCKANIANVRSKLLQRAHAPAPRHPNGSNEKTRGLVENS
jgi:hypothetical protein